MGCVWADQMRELQSLTFHESTHDISGLLLSIDRSTVGHRGAVEEVLGIDRCVVKIPESFFPPERVEVLLLKKFKEFPCL